MKKELLILTAACSMLSSCGVYTRYHQATDVPQGIYGEEVSTDTEAASLGSLPWREVFTDPTLQALIEKGLQNNTDLQSARLRVEECEAAMLSAKLAYLPSFALTPQGTVSSYDHMKATQTYQLPVSASWQVDIFGSIRNAKRKAKAQLEQSRDYRQAVQTQIIAGIANTYYTLLALDEQLKISEETEKAWAESVRSTKALMQAGQANEAAVGQMEAAHSAVCASVLSLKEQVNQVENSLSLLLAEVPHRIERPAPDQVAAPVATNLSVGVPMAMLANRPDVRASERSLEAAFYGTNAARSAFYPSITLSGAAGWTNSAGSMIINPGKFVASAVGSLTQPLFAQGKLIAQYKIAKAQQEEAELAFTQTLLNAGAEVNEALVAYQTAEAKTIHYANQVSALQKAYRSTQLLMENGTTTYLEVLTAQQSLLNAQLTQTSNRLTQAQSFINLYKALGGGQEE